MAKIRIVNNKHELHEPLSGPFTQFRSNLHLVILQLTNLNLFVLAIEGII